MGIDPDVLSDSARLALIDVPRLISHIRFANTTNEARDARAGKDA
jgi:hypothetical protein